jgi:hypothetical protein
MVPDAFLVILYLASSHAPAVVDLPRIGGQRSGITSRLKTSDNAFLLSARRSGIFRFAAMP